MVSKPRCSKAAPKIKDMALYCDGSCLCAHQYYCPATRRYENTPGYGNCKRLKPAPAEEVSGVKFNVLPKRKEVQEAKPEPTTFSVDGQYTQNVIPKPETPTEEHTETKTKKSEGRQKNGQVRNTRRRSVKKG